MSFKGFIKTNGTNCAGNPINPTMGSKKLFIYPNTLESLSILTATNIANRDGNILIQTDNPSFAPSKNHS